MIILFIRYFDEYQLVIAFITIENLVLWHVTAVGSAWSTAHRWRPVDEVVPQEAKITPVFSVQRYACVWKRCYRREKGKFLQLICTTSTNVLWIRHCSAYSEPITSHALGRLACSWRMLLHYAVVKSWRHIINNLTMSVDAYLLEEQSCQTLSRSHLKWRSLRLFWSVAANKKHNMV